MEVQVVHSESTSQFNENHNAHYTRNKIIFWLYLLLATLGAAAHIYLIVVNWGNMQTFS